MKITSLQNSKNEIIKKALKPYEEIAEGMEANFTQHLLQEMKKTVPKENPDSAPMDYYNSLLDSERAQIMAKSDSGIGIKKIILDQITPTHLKQNSILSKNIREMKSKEISHE